MIDKLKGLTAISRKKKNKEAVLQGSRAGQMLSILKKSHGDASKFTIYPVRSVTTLPKPVEGMHANIIYPLIRPYAYASIKFDNKEGLVVYNVIEPNLTAHEQQVLAKIKEGLVQVIDISLEDIKEESVMVFLEESTDRLLDEYGFNLSRKEYVKIMYYIYRDFVGLNRIEPFMHDPYIEDIAVDGVGIPVYIVHQKFGSMRTNIVYNEIEDLREFVTKLAERCDRYISYAEPLLDGSLKDGTRVQASLASDVTTRGPTFSLRKFKELPLTPVDMVRLNTANAEMLAYIWFIIENGSNILLAGGVSTGKCVTGDCCMQMADGSIVSAEELYSNLGIKKKYGIMTLEGGMKSYPFPVNKFWKFDAPDFLSRTETQRGSSVVTTMEHEFIVMRNGRIARLRADRLAKGDYIATPRVTRTITEKQKINLLDYDINAYARNNYDTVKKAAEKLLAKHGSHAAICRHFGIKYKTFGEWLKNNAIPLKMLKKLCAEAEITIGEDDINMLSAKTSNLAIKPIKEVSKQLARIVGYIMADGHIDKTTARLFNEEKIIRDDFAKCIKDTFGIEAVSRKYGKRVAYSEASSSVIAEILTKVFGIKRGKKADTCFVPQILLRSPDDEAASLLSALFDCESHVSKKQCEIEFSTASEKLAKQIPYLLLRFGIIARVSKKPAGDRTYYRIRISGKESLELFKNKISYTSLKKSQALDAIIRKTRRYQTNVDSVPVGPVIRKILEEYNISKSQLAKMCGTKRETIRDITKDKVNPSKNMLRRIAFALPECQDTLYLRALADADIFWDRVVKAEKIINTEFKHVYDVTVDGTHNFVAGNFGGMFISNTSMLNAVSMFIPADAKIVSIEDSVTGDTEIVIKEHDKIKTVKIGEFIDTLLAEEGYTERITNKKGIEVLTIDGDYKMTFKHVGTFLRHKVTKDIYEITTATGRKVKVTKDHSLFGLDENGEIVPSTPEELQKLRFLAVPRLVPWAGRETKTLNLLEYLDAFKGDFISGTLGEVFEKTDYNEFKKLGIPQQKYRYWKKHRIIEASVFKKLLRDKTYIEPGKLQIIGKRKSKPIPVLFDVSDEFLEFLGLWLGDGCFDSHNKNRVIISNIDKECIECVNNVAEKLGVHVSLMPDKVSMSVNSTLLYKMMLALGFNGHADTKRVPEFIFNLSQKQTAAFLSGYFSADGCVKNFEVSCSSQSLGLLNDVQTLLLRFGIISRISHYPRKGNCRELSISSHENIEKFKEIGFLQERKAAKVIMLSERKSHHTKTDIIPLGEGLLQEINRFEKLSWPYRNGLQNIGRQFLMEINEDADSEIIDRLAHSDIFWDRVKEIRKLPRQQIYVYDISVPETENFVGANILLHNTRELNLPHENWVPGVSRAGFGGSKVGEVGMFELLRESFRQNPDYLIVGEIRGKEAYVMFQGMASIPGEEKVAVLNDEHLKFIPIGEMESKTYKTFTLDAESGEIKTAPVKARVMHRPQSVLYRITTKSGREVVTTAYHSLFTFDKGIRPIEAEKLRKGDVIVVPGRIPSGFADMDFLDLTGLESARIFAPEYFKRAVKKLGFEKASKICGVKSISDYYANFKRAQPASMKADKFFRLMKEAELDVDKSKIQVKFLRKSRPYPALVKITPEFLRLIGYYLSEGSLNQSGKNSRISIYNKNPEILEDMRRCVRAMGDIKIRERITEGYGTCTEIAFSHKVLFELLRQKCGMKSQEKRIPDFIFGLPKEKIGAFLSALFSGNGYFSKTRFGYYTSSREMANNIAYLLLVYGIVARIIKKKSRNHEGKYEYDLMFCRRGEREEFLKFVKPVGKQAKIEDVKIVSKNDKFKDVFLDRIKSVEKIELDKPVDVYDLVVPGTQSFLGGFGGIGLHNSGHPSISTIHAGGIDDLLKRLQTRPINLSAGLIESLDVVVVMIHARERGKSARRVKEIIEIESIDAQTGTPRTVKVFTWIPHDDAFEYRGDSWLLHKISTQKGLAMTNIIRELARRKKFIEWMTEKNIVTVKEQAKYINLYYKNPRAVDRLLAGAKLSEEELHE